MKPAVIVSSLFLLLSFSWSVLMELTLQHRGFIARATVAAVIALYAALTLVYTRAPSTALRQVLTVASLTAITLGFFGLLAALHQTHFEGYLLLLAVALFAQSILTLVDILYPQPLPA
jgi:uncharacterized BrkB/YihY/UPF0761 family membrane protein